MTEQEYLNYTQKFISEEIDKLHRDLQKGNISRKDTMTYIWDNISAIDTAEMVYWDMEISSVDAHTQNTMKEINQLQGTANSPFFGSLILQYDRRESNETYYIGMKGLHNGSAFKPIVIDWRTPLASLFYEGDIGDCSYQCPTGAVNVHMLTKKQILIRNGILESTMDISDPIHDSLLLNYLEQNGTREMKTIVASLQKEQNHIIRMDTNKSMFLLGPAGSGKTSIALHRAAFLLYKNDLLKAEQIAFISPKKYLHNYISCVLPNLNEDNINISTYEDLCGDLIANYKIEIQTASTFSTKQQIDILKCIDEFSKVLETLCFHPTDICYENLTVTKDDISRLFIFTFKSEPLFIKSKLIIDELKEEFSSLYKGEKKSLFLLNLNQYLNKMLIYYDLKTIYLKFIQWLQTSKKMKDLDSNSMDVNLSLILYNRFFCSIRDEKIKYVIVDEMQDIMPLQHAVINNCFRCPFLIVGDIHQSEYYLPEEFEFVRTIYDNKPEIFELLNCYRSTFEIVEFSKLIISNTSILPIKRHGEIISWNIKVNEEDEYTCLINHICQEKETHNWNTIALITPNKNINKYVSALLLSKTSLSVIENSIESKADVYVFELSKVKGLEFDCVFLCDIGEMFTDVFGKNRLYIGVTRALHKAILYSGKISDKTIAETLTLDGNI